MLIDCDTCTVRGQGCDDCVVTVLLGAPPGWRGSDPTVVPLIPRPALRAEAREGRVGRSRAAAAEDRRAVADATGDDVAARPGGTLVSGPAPLDTPGPSADRTRGVVVELDEVERRAVRALAEVGLVPPLRHRSPTTREVG